MLEFNRIPQHLAIIMDGNGRWANVRGLNRIEGHKAGALAVRKTVEECRRLGVRYLTLYSFSSENWKRSKEEVSGLMNLFKQYLDSEVDSLYESGIRIRAIGDLEKLPFAVRAALTRDIKRTADNNKMDLILAISYGGRDEIVAAVKSIAAKVKKNEIDIEEIDDRYIAKNLWTSGIPDPDLLIRTSGEMRVSNFLLWQIAYSELIVIDNFWPDFNEETLNRCLEIYQNRERRFGRTSVDHAY